MDMVTWSRRHLGALALVGVLAPVLVIVRLTVPDAALVTTAVGFCAALGSLVMSFLVRRQVRSLNQPAGLDRDRVTRIGQANRAGSQPIAEDVPAARVVYGVGVAEWTRYCWAFAGMLHVTLAWGFAASPLIGWRVAVGAVLAASALAIGTVATVNVLRLRARLTALPAS